MTGWRSIAWGRGAIVSRLLGVVAMVLGTTCAMEAYRLWTGWAGSGVLPAAVAIIFIVLAVGFAAFPSVHTEGVKGLTRNEAQPIVIVIVAFGLYLTLIPFIGFLVASWAFLFATTYFAARSSAVAALLWSGVLSVASHFVFRVGLGTPLPVGALGF